MPVFSFTGYMAKDHVINTPEFPGHHLLIGYDYRIMG